MPRSPPFIILFSEMANIAVSLTQSLSTHAFRLLGVADLQVLIVVEDPNGNRIWTANGKLRNEFVNEKKIENRSWAMVELEFENDVRKDDDEDLRTLKPKIEPKIEENIVKSSNPSADSAAFKGPSKHLNGSSEPELKEISTSSLREIVNRVNLPRSSFDPPKSSIPVPQPSPIPVPETNGLALACIHCGRGHSALDCPMVNVCPSCGVLGHAVVDCPKRAKVFLNTTPTTDVLQPSSKKPRLAFLGSTPTATPSEKDAAQVQEASSKSIKCDHTAAVTCYKCGAPGHYADKCTETHRSLIERENREVTCFKCGKKGHYANKCDWYAREGQRARESVEREAKRSKERSAERSADDDVIVLEPSPKKASPERAAPHAKVVCHKCGQLGHKSPDCPNRAKGRDAVVCYTCGKPGHKKPDCPAAVSSKNKKEGSARVDPSPDSQARNTPRVEDVPDGDDADIDYREEGVRSAKIGHRLQLLNAVVRTPVCTWWEVIVVLTLRRIGITLIEVSSFTAIYSRE